MQGSMAAEGMERCAARLRGAAATRSMAAEVMPRCKAWLARGCQCAEHGCPGDAEVQGSKAAALVKIHVFTFFEKKCEPRAKWACQHLYI